jgi:hypothetical protein
MKIKIGPYRNWFGPYQLAEKLCFWAEKEKDEYGFEHDPQWVHDFGEWLAHGNIKSKERKPHKFMESREQTWLFKFLGWIHSKQHREMYIHIDKFDTWGMDSTLSPIIVPMLIQLRDNTHGYPAEFSSDFHVNYNQNCFEGEGWEMPEETGMDEWKEILDKMIWAFEQVSEEWEDQYRSGNIEFDCIPCEDSDNWELVKGDDDTSEADYDGMRKHQERMQEGFDLFGKYYRNLWD